MDEFKEIPIETIYWTGSTDITEDEIKRMAASILMHGLVEPIVVCPRTELGYRGAVGRLRYEGMKHRWRGEPSGKTILCRIHGFESELEIVTWQLVENIHRRRVTAMQRANQFRQMYNLLKPDYAEGAIVRSLSMAIEEATGDSESVKTVYKYLAMTKLPENIQKLILPEEKFGVKHAEQIMRLKDSPEKQVELAETSVQEDWSVTQLKKKVDEVQSPTEESRESVGNSSVWCQICGETLRLIHVDPKGTHKLERVEAL